MNKMKTSHLLRSLLLCLAATLTGCVTWNPWVEPHQQVHFADPIMAFERNPVAAHAIETVQQAREGARGAECCLGGRCGC